MANYTPRANEFTVNTGTAGTQENPQVTVLTNGNFVVVWQGLGSNGDPDIHAQIYSATGVPIGGEFLINEARVGTQALPSVAALPGGGFVVAYEHYSGDNINIKTSAFGATGQRVGFETTFAGPNEFSTDPSIAVLSDGRWLLTFTSQQSASGGFSSAGDGSGAGIKAYIINGNSFTGVPVNTVTAGAQVASSATALSNGSFVVTWMDAGGGDSSGTAVKLQLFHNNGTKIGTEIFVNTSTVGNQTQPQIATLADGGFVVVWTDASGTGDTTGRSIKAQRFDAAGVKQGGEILVNTTTAGDQIQPKVSATGDGGFVVTWTDGSGSGDTDSSGIRGQSFDASGNKNGLEFRINAITAGAQDMSAVAVLSATDIVAVWTDYSGEGDTAAPGIKARIFTSAIQGTAGSDNLTGTVADDLILALGSEDTVLAQQGGNDTIEGGDGVDVIYLGEAFTAADRIDGGAGRDVVALQGNYANLVLEPGSLANVEVLSLMTYTDNVYGGADAGPNGYAIRTVDETVAPGQALTVEAGVLEAGETLNFNGQAETDGKFVLNGGRGNDTLLAGAGDDMLNGGVGADTMNGGLGGDIYFVDNGGDVVQDSGPGFDSVYTSVSYSLAGAAEIELLATTNSGSLIGLQLAGNGFSQTIVGTNGGDSLHGGDGGNDYLIGNGGNDTLVAYNNSVLAGGTGDDTYFVRDWFQVLNESAGQGFDRVYVESSFVLLGDVEVEQLIFQGGTGGVALYGNGFAQALRGSGASDELYGFGGNDLLIGDAGNDSLDGGAGADSMEGGAGGDIYFVDNELDVISESGPTSDFNSVYASASYALSAAAPISLLATTDSSGGGAIDLTGSNLAQTIIGNNGANRLLGLDGNDYLIGGGGADILDGGAGDDILEGGSGADVFRFSATSDIVVSSGDQIRDFLSGTDKIDLSLIDANTTTAGDQAFTFIGTGAFTGQAGQLRHEVANGQVHISGDTNGDGLADFQIVLNNTTIVAAGDFML